MANLMGAEFWVVSSRTGEGITDLFSRIAGLCFDKVVKIEYEGFNKYNHFNVGQSLLCKFNIETNLINDILFVSKSFRFVFLYVFSFFLSLRPLFFETAFFM